MKRYIALQKIVELGSFSKAASPSPAGGLLI